MNKYPSARPPRKNTDGLIPFLSQSIKKIYTSVCESLFPRGCVICRQRLSPDEHAICAGCLMSLPVVRFPSFSDNPMARTFWHLIPVERATAGFYYSRHSSTKHLFYAFKYGRQPKVAYQMGIWLAGRLLPTGFFDGIDFMLPVPLALSHQIKRGYNQSEWLAQGISSVTGLPIRTDCLSRNEVRHSQTRLRRNERITNVKDSILNRQPGKLKDKHILLIDDIMTTGATLLACGEALKTTEGIRISILTLGLTQTSTGINR